MCLLIILQRTIDYLKMDVEFSEWPALVNMIRSGTINNIRQMALEVHTPEMDIHRRPDHKCTWSTPETITFMVKTLFDLNNAGFSMYYSRTNYRTPYISPYSGKQRYCCYDIHLVNTKHKDNQHQERNQHPLRRHWMWIYCHGDLKTCCYIYKCAFLCTHTHTHTHHTHTHTYSVLISYASFAKKNFLPCNFSIMVINKLFTKTYPR